MFGNDMCSLIEFASRTERLSKEKPLRPGYFGFLSDIIFVTDDFNTTDF